MDGGPSAIPGTKPRTPRWSNPAVMRQRELPQQQRLTTTRPWPNSIHDVAPTLSIGSLTKHEAHLDRAYSPTETISRCRFRLCWKSCIQLAAASTGERDRSLISAQSFPGTPDSARKACDGLLPRLPWFHRNPDGACKSECEYFPNNSQTVKEHVEQNDAGFVSHVSGRKKKKNASSGSPNGSYTHNMACS